MGHFYESIPADVRGLSDADAIERFAAGGDVPARAIEGLTPEQLRAFPAPGWSIQQIVAHLADSDQVAAYRMKRIIAEDRPELDVYDETAFAERLGYQSLDARAVCELFRLNRQLMAQILRGLDSAAFDRRAIHPEIGDLSLGQMVRIYINHVEHHLGFIRRKKDLILRGSAVA
jgi:hypothetical protein